MNLRRRPGSGERSLCRSTERKTTGKSLSNLCFGIHLKAGPFLPHPIFPGLLLSTVAVDRPTIRPVLSTAVTKIAAHLGPLAHTEWKAVQPAHEAFVFVQMVAVFNQHPQKTIN